MKAVSGLSGRVAVGAVAVVAVTGLVIQYRAGLERNGSALGNLWVMARYFTILSNVFLAIVLGGIALGADDLNRPRLLAWAVLSILLVGILYGLFLRGLLELSGGDAVADLLLHKVTPVAAVLVWLAFAAKGGLRLSDAWLWTSFPLAYVVYVLMRGSLDGNYAYPFFDVGQLGWICVAANCLGMGAGFLGAGWALVWLDGVLARRVTA